MATGLHNLFNQIIQSEERTHWRKDRIYKLKAELSATQKKAKDSTEELKSYEGELVLKTQQLVDSSLQKQWLESKTGILQNLVDSLKQEHNDSKEKLSAVTCSYCNAQKEFCGDVQLFSVDYDLVSNGYKKREEKAQVELQQLIQQEKMMHGALSQRQAKQGCVKKLQEERDKLQRQIASRKKELEKIQGEIQLAKKNVMKWEREKELVSRYPQENSEFKRLRSELDRQKESSMKALQMEVQELKQNMWQVEHNKQMKKAQKQQRQRFIFNKTAAAQNMSNVKLQGDYNLGKPGHAAVVNDGKSETGFGEEDDDEADLFQEFTNDSEEFYPVNFHKDLNVQAESSHSHADEGVDKLAFRKHSEQKLIECESKLITPEKNHRPNLEKLKNAMKQKTN